MGCNVALRLENMTDDVETDYLECVVDDIADNLVD